MTVLSRVLLTGASGLVGSHLLRLLRAEHPSLIIKSLSRRPLNGLDELSGDLLNLPAMDGEFDLVFHAAAELSNSPSMFMVNVEGTRNLLNWSIDHGVKRFVHVSSVGVYGRQNCTNVTESASRRPNSPYARSKSLAEDEVRESCARAGIEYVIFQPASVLGHMPGRAPQLLTLMRMVKNGRYRRFGGSDACANYISATAVARGIALGLSPILANASFILNTPTPLGSIIRWIAEELGVNVPVKSMPRIGGLAAGLLASAISRSAGVRLPFSYSRYREVTMTTCYDGSAISRATGFCYEPDIESTIRAMTRTYVEEKLL